MARRSRRRSTSRRRSGKSAARKLIRAIKIGYRL